MTGAEIVAEALHGTPLTQAQIDRFRGEGVPAGALMKTALGDWSLVLRAQVEFCGIRFERRDRETDATGAYIWPAHDEFGEVVDLVAWRPPSIMATWLGRAAMLGQELVQAPRFEPLRVFETVLDWFRAGRNGVVIVDPVHAAGLLRETGPLQVATIAHRRQHEAMLTLRAPRIEVRAASRMEAAE